MGFLSKWIKGKVVAKLKTRFKEASTWRALLLGLGVFGVKVRPDLIEPIATVAATGMVIVGLLFPDSLESSPQPVQSSQPVAPPVPTGAGEIPPGATLEPGPVWDGKIDGGFRPGV